MPTEDARRLEREKESYKKHLYFPQELGDKSGQYKNAIRFKAYGQTRSFQNNPGETPYVRELPTQYQSGRRTFPITGTAFFTAFSLRSGGVAIQSVANLIGRSVSVPDSTIIEDLLGVGLLGVQYFSVGQQTFYGRRTRSLDNSITLYMPDMVINSDKHDYQPISLNQASGKAGLYTAAFDGSALGNVETFAELAGRAGIFGGRSTEAFLSGLGYALNPMLEMVYGGTQPRTFAFQFKFAPRNHKEAEDVLNIIKTFRFHSHSESADKPDDPMSKGSGTRYLVPPNHFEIEFLRRKSDGRFEENLAMPRVTTCMLAQVNTNYAAQLESFATFRDGIPVSISMELEFIESVILTKRDIRTGY